MNVLPGAWFIYHNFALRVGVADLLWAEVMLELHFIEKAIRDLMFPDTSIRLEFVFNVPTGRGILLLPNVHFQC